MKILFLFLLQGILLPPLQDDDPQPQPPQLEFASPAAATAFFYDLDNQQMRAMVGHDSAFFARHFTSAFFNCSATGELNDRAAEIQDLLATPWVSVERMAPQFDVFAYSGTLASLTTTKRIKIDLPGGPAFFYVRRTSVFQKQDGNWQSIYGHGTYVQTHFVGL